MLFSPTHFFCSWDWHATTRGQRQDDRPEAVSVRLRTHHQATGPLTAHYRKKGLLLCIDANGRPDEILAATLEQLAAHTAGH